MVTEQVVQPHAPPSYQSHLQLDRGVGVERSRAPGGTGDAAGDVAVYSRRITFDVAAGPSPPPTT